MGRRQQHQHFVDGFQPLIGIGNFWEEHTPGMSGQPCGIKVRRAATSLAIDGGDA